MQTGECRSGQWSSWDDRDNPGGTGDWELIHLRHDYEELCKTPEAAEARVVSTGAMVTNQVVDFGPTGLACQNEQQIDGQCLDYQVRFCCAAQNTGPMTLGHCNNGKWSAWQNTDHPSGTGDWDINPPCENVSGVEGRIAQTLATSTHQDVHLSLNGLWCVNKDNDGGCLDYEVRYCCAGIDDEPPSLLFMIVSGE